MSSMKRRSNAERVVTLQAHLTHMNIELGLSVPLLEALQREVPELEDLSGYRERTVAGAGEDAASHYAATSVQPGVFRLLGARPVAGRLLDDADAQPGAPLDAVIAWDLAQQRFGGGAAVGRTLRLADGDARIVGVLPPDFGFPRATNQLWLPLSFSAAQRAAEQAGSFGEIGAIARLSPATTPAAAEAHIDATARGLAELKNVVDMMGLRVPCAPLRDFWLGDRAPALGLMLLALGLVLLVALANVCNLSIARQVARQRELAVEKALGAGPWRSLCQVAAEALLLAGAAAVLGAILVSPTLSLLRALDVMPTDAPQSFGVDGVSLAFLVALAGIATAALTAVGVALQRRGFAQALQGGARLTAGRGTQRARQVLIVAQIGVAAALLLGIGLLLRSSQQLLREDVGFERDGLALGRINGLPPTEGNHVPTPDEEAAARSALRLLRERVQALPGVAAAGVGNVAPFSGGATVINYSFPQPGGGAPLEAAINLGKVDAGYFDALGVRPLRGRTFTADEVRNQADVAVVDAEFARLAFGDGDPLGQNVRLYDQTGGTLRVIGVVPNVKQHALDEKVERATVYRTDEFPLNAVLLVRTHNDVALLSAPLQAVFREIAPQARLDEWQPMRERLRASLKDRLRLDALLQLFGALALLLAAVGLYAVLAYSVRTRSAEFGVRMALGASAARLTRAVLRQGAVLIVAGFAVSLPLGWAFAHVLQSRLYRVDAFDPAALAGVLGLFGAVGLLACWLPARRAGQVDPNVALRQN